MKKVQAFMIQAGDIIHTKFRFATLNFIFVMTFITVMQTIFGASNSIVAVIFIQIMLSTMNRDTSASPWKHMVIQTCVLLLMGIGSCISVQLLPLYAIPLNFIILFILLYAYTFEYLDCLYFPYVLSYIFFVCLAPISYAQLPQRMVMILIGSISIMLYQWFMGRNRMKNTTKSVLLNIMDVANTCIQHTLHQEPFHEDYQKLRQEMCTLSKLIYDRRKKTLCISDAAFATIDVGRGLESLIIQLAYQNKELTPLRKELFYQITYYLSCFRAYVLQEENEIPSIDFSHLPIQNAEVKHTADKLTYLRNHFYAMRKDDKKDHYQPTLLSYTNRIQSALHLSQVRFLYALRVSLLLALGLYAILELHLGHGRWLLFTIASISLPYADDIKQKAKKRLLATLCGCAIGFISFTLISDITMRTIILTLSGYIMFYLSDYATSFTCGTVGALGGAMMSSAFGISAIGNVVMIRIFYIILGILIAYLVNVYMYPMHREKATRLLAEKYKQTSALLREVCSSKQMDTQLYYNLIIQTFLQEEMLRKHAAYLHWNKMDDFLEEIQTTVRLTHRNYAR